MRARAAALIQRLKSDRLAAKRLGIGRATLSRLLAGQLLSPGTLALVEKNFPAAEASS